MALITILTKNKDLTWALNKNPQTQRESGTPWTKKLRQGMIYGWFNKPWLEDTPLDKDNPLYQYRLWFKDSRSVASFDDRQTNFEYLDKSRYTSPFGLMSMITGALHEPATRQYEQDNQTVFMKFDVEVTHFSIFERVIRSFNKNEGVIISYSLRNDVAGEYQGHSTRKDNRFGFASVSISAPTLYKVLNLARTILLFMAFHDSRVDMGLKRTDYLRYVQYLYNSDAPYEVYYLFNRSIVKERSAFGSVYQFYKENLADKFILNWGDTSQHRVSFLRGHIGKGFKITEIGAGEGNVVHGFVRTTPEYLAIDKDETLAEELGWMGKRKKYDTLVPRHAEVTPELLGAEPEIIEGREVILTEVIEHMPEEDAVNLISAVLQAKPHGLYVTTPNKDFNQFYSMDISQDRHDDHHFEWVEEHARHVFGEIASLFPDYEYQFLPVGDIVKVDGKDIACSHGAVFVRRKA